MKIAVDIDEVLCPFLEHFIPFVNERLKTTHTIADFNTYNLEEVIDRPIQEVIDVVRAFYREKLETIPSFLEAKPVLEKLKEKHELIVLTSRHNEAIEKTPFWIEKHFPGIFKEIIFSSNPAIQHKRPKAIVCKELQVDILIEDDPRHIDVCIKEGVSVIMPNRLWNAKIENEKVHRVDNWEEIIQVIQTTKDKKMNITIKD